MSRVVKSLGFALAGALWLAPAAQAQAILTLADAVTQGLSASPELKQAQLDLQKAQLGVDGAQAQRIQYTSDLSLGDLYGANGVLSSQTAQQGNVPTANGTISLTVPIFTGFKLSNQVSQAQAQAMYSQARRDQVSQDLAYQITQAYWNARRAELRARIQQDATDQARASRDVVQANYNIGRADGNELDRVEVSLYNQQSDLLKAKGDQDVAREELASLLQRDLTGVTLADPPVVLASDRLPPSLDAALKAADEIRPDVREAQAQLAAAQAGVWIAKGDLYPQVNLVTAYQEGNNPYVPQQGASSVLSSFAGVWDAGVTLSYHLFDHGVTDRNIRKSALDLDSAQQALVSAQRKAQLEVRQAYRQLETSQARVALGEKSETLAIKNLAWISGRFKFGYALSVELNEARVNLVTSRSQRVDAEIDLQLAQAALRKAMGRFEVGVPARANSK